MSTMGMFSIVGDIIFCYLSTVREKNCQFWFYIDSDRFRARILFLTIKFSFSFSNL